MLRKNRNDTLAANVDQLKTIGTVKVPPGSSLACRDGTPPVAPALTGTGSEVAAMVETTVSAAAMVPPRRS